MIENLALTGSTGTTVADRSGCGRRSRGSAKASMTSSPTMMRVQSALSKRLEVLLERGPRDSKPFVIVKRRKPAATSKAGKTRQSPPSAAKTLARKSSKSRLLKSKVKARSKTAKPIMLVAGASSSPLDKVKPQPSLDPSLFSPRAVAATVAVASAPISASASSAALEAPPLAQHAASSTPPASDRPHSLHKQQSPPAKQANTTKIVEAGHSKKKQKMKKTKKKKKAKKTPAKSQKIYGSISSKLKDLQAKLSSRVSSPLPRATQGIIASLAMSPQRSSKGGVPVAAEVAVAASAAAGPTTSSTTTTTTTTNIGIIHIKVDSPRLAHRPIPSSTAKARRIKSSGALRELSASDVNVKGTNGSSHNVDAKESKVVVATSRKEQKLQVKKKQTQKQKQKGFHHAFASMLSGDGTPLDEAGSILCSIGLPLPRKARKSGGERLQRWAAFLGSAELEETANEVQAQRLLIEDGEDREQQQEEKGRNDETSLIVKPGLGDARARRAYEHFLALHRKHEKLPRRRDPKALIRDLAKDIGCK